MKVTWTPQTKTDDPKEALEMSIAKWRFFSYCTKAQLRRFAEYMMDNCGLCWCHNTNLDGPCGDCPFAVDSAGCPDILFAARDIASACIYDKATLKDFHAASRKVWEKLKGLR